MENSPARPSASAPVPASTPPRHQPISPTPVNRHRPEKKQFPLKKISLFTGIGLLIAVALIFFVLFFMQRSVGNGAIDSNKYQAVFLTNGNQYFGKLKEVNGETMSLTHVFYLERKASDDPEGTEESTAPADDIQLIKRGNEIHGPDDEMIIDKRQILFFENLKADGKVSKAIAGYQQ